jgi:hypothetical protein
MRAEGIENKGFSGHLSRKKSTYVERLTQLLPAVTVFAGKIPPLPYKAALSFRAD